MSPLRLANFIVPEREVKALKKLLSFILALLFTFGVVGAGLAQPAAPEDQPAAAAEQTAPKKTKKAKHKKSKKHKKTKKPADTTVQ
jgi:hypothetical protein